MPPPASPAWTVLCLLASLPTSTLPSAQMPRSASDRGIIIAQLSSARNNIVIIIRFDSAHTVRPRPGLGHLCPGPSEVPWCQVNREM